jgi:hypothetical protein
MPLSHSSLPPDAPVDIETQRMAAAAWEKWGATCAWFMERPDFSVVRGIELFLRYLRKNGNAAAWYDARTIAARIA